MSLLGKIAGFGWKAATGGLLGATVQTVAGAVKPKPKPPSVTSPWPSTVRPDSTVERGGGVTVPTPFGRVGVSGSKRVTYYSPSGKPRKKTRRMNPTNFRALSRAIRRVGKFQDMAKAVGFSRAPSTMKGVRFPKRKRTRACR